MRSEVPGRQGSPLPEEGGPRTWWPTKGEEQWLFLDEPVLPNRQKDQHRKTRGLFRLGGEKRQFRIWGLGAFKGIAKLATSLNTLWNPLSLTVRNTQSKLPVPILLVRRFRERWEVLAAPEASLLGWFSLSAAASKIRRLESFSPSPEPGTVPLLVKSPLPNQTSKVCSC